MLTEEMLRIIEQYEVIEVVSEKEKGSVAIVINTAEEKMAVRKQINSNKMELFQKLSNIHNYNLPEIYHLFSDEVSVTIIEEFIEGITLETMIQNKSHISEQEFLSMMLQLCNALSKLHHESPPIIHRDIKPKNIIYTKDKRLVLIDFDASREFKKDTDKDTRYLGTMEYAPPEQFGHSQTDVRSDIYAIGMTMNELVRNGLVELHHGDRIQGIIDQCTMFDPNKRYQTIEDFGKDLRSLKNSRSQNRRFCRFFAFFSGAIIVIFAVIFLLIKQSNDMDDTLEGSDNIHSTLVEMDAENSDVLLTGKDYVSVIETSEADTDNSDDRISTAEIVKEADIENPVIVNQYIDYYKHEKYMDDLKIYINFNDSSEITYLSLMNFGRVSDENYYIDGSLLVIKKEYLNTLPPFYYELSIGFDKGNPANMVFEVHDEDEESVYGEYRLSHYSKKYYTSSPEDFTLLVYDTNGAKIQGLYHGKEKIEPEYYMIEENGVVVILDKSYVGDMEIGTIFDLGIELDNGILKKMSVQVLERPIQHASLEVYEFFYSIESPDDILIQITWNDSKEVTHLLPVAEKDPIITDQQYRIDGDIINISKEALEGVTPGDYEWAIVYDTGSESMFRITVIE